MEAMIASDSDLRLALLELCFDGRAEGLLLDDRELEFIDQIVASDIPLSRRQRKIAMEILESHLRPAGA